MHLRHSQLLKVIIVDFVGGYSHLTQCSKILVRIRSPNISSNLQVL